MIETGTLFLSRLRKRALGDGRVLLAETTIIAGIAAYASQVEYGWYGFEFTSTTAPLIVAVIAGILWAVVCGVVMHYARQSHREYIVIILTDTGLLYLALEHDPHEALAPLKSRENLLRLSSARGGDLSFRQRMLILAARYPACAAAVGFQPYPGKWSYLLTALLTIAAFVAVVYTIVIIQAFNAAQQQLPHPAGLAKFLGQSLVWLILTYAVLIHARRAGPRLALADVLIGEEEDGQAIRAGG